MSKLTIIRIPEISFPDLDFKFPEIQDFLNINMMNVSDMMTFLTDMDLSDKADQLKSLADSLLTKLNEGVCSIYLLISYQCCK